MNLDVPYYRLGNPENVEYIPLKLALNDEQEQKNVDDKTNKIFTNADSIKMSNDNNNNNNMSIGIVILIGLVVFAVLFLLLYLIYYFIILRQQVRYSNDIELEPIIFNKFD
ncbi:ac78 [Oxyplax ochracea nucleopolyhedrovirus]|uniref:Ac78 n=1 Tax=Oxyplax ochracea nucleopolyhedrovirus TaxID=2083176 RepID=A0A2L0WU29_9ABAC|nr:ac78 [Oxyplax ochracea nucleopolyhedrovirus]AVA31159.1 ac78 [Oxyplax ochracea nucleopolyhedrovirus]